MLNAETTKFGAGIAISGDRLDLVDLYETIHHFASDHGPISSQHGEFVLGFAYDVRHAYQGDRRTKNMQSFGLGSKVDYFEFNAIWIIFLVQLGMLRSAAAYLINDRSHQSNLYRLEYCVESALQTVDAKVANECMRWLGNFTLLPENFLINFVSELSGRHLSENTTLKKRISSLPDYLSCISMFSSEYKSYENHLKKLAEAQNCRPEDLINLSDFPAFKW